MMTPFEWVVGDSSKDHTVTALPPTAAQPPRYTTLRGTTSLAPRKAQPPRSDTRQIITPTCHNQSSDSIPPTQPAYERSGLTDMLQTDNTDNHIGLRSTITT